MMNNSNQNPERSSTSNASELPWLAFCYVANELDAPTRREFEIRLERDQIAREAVARAFDNAWMLDQALTQDASEVPTTTYELPQPVAKQTARSGSVKPKPAWPKMLLGIGIAGLLAFALLQITWTPANLEVAQNIDSSTPSERTNASVSLAETWADSQWDAELDTDVADVETSLTQLQHSDVKQILTQDEEQDDWMTATLLDMAEDLEPLPQQFGS